ATGNVTVYVDGKAYPGEIRDGVATVIIDNLTAGDKTFAVEYSGDGNFSANYTIGNLTVKEAKVVPDMKVIDYGNGTVVVVVGDNATGNVTVKVGDKEYNATVVNGTAVVQLDGNVTPGTHEVEVIYSGDATHEASNATAEITAPKYNSPIKVDVSEVTEGEPLAVTVEVPENATGNVTVYVDGKAYPGEIKDGVAVVTIDNLTAGDKTFVVEYSGDGNFSANYTIGNFTVKEAKAVPDIKVIDQGNGTVVVVVGDNATGNVTVKVGNDTYTAEVINGTATITLDNVTPGKNDVEVIYSGDSTHDASSINTTVTGPKYDTAFEINVTEVTEGETATVTVKVPENATGNVTVTIDGHKYAAEIVNGTATIPISNLTAGDKSLVVEYSGDDNYASNYTVSNFKVDEAKVVPDMRVIDYGNGTVVVVVGDNATGNVTVKVGDKEYNATVVNGTAVVQLDGNVTPGTHEVEVIYSGDATHEASNATAEITAPKYNSPIKVDVSEVTEGEPLVITVNAPEGATGNVTVYVDGKAYSGEIKDGVAVVTIDNLTAGDKTFAVEYSGDGNFSANYTIGNLTVKEAKAVPDMKVVDYGNGTVVVVVGDNATGNVTVKVGNDTYTAEVINGTATITADNLIPGKNSVEVIYSGDDTHASSSVNATVTGPKYDSPIEIITVPGGVGEDTVITVKAPEDATGNVTIEVDGVKYTAEVINGTATVRVNNLTEGTKTIAVEYTGDENYQGAHTTATVTVSKVKSHVSATVTDINVGENVTITVTVPYDATGQVLIDIDGVGYYVNVTNGTGTIQIPRMPNGIYPVNVTYIGDDKYLPSSNYTVFDVNKVPSYVIPTAKNILVGQNEVIMFEVPKDATGNLTVIIDGEEFTFDLDEILGAPIYEDGKFSVAVSDGQGILVISGLPKGTYTVTVTYNGNYKYLKSTNTTTFIVSQKDTEMSVADQGNRTVKVYVSDNATGNVTVRVGNQTYTAEVIDGVATVNLNNVSGGVHDIEVVYSGDNDHASKTIESSVAIPKLVTEISVTGHDIYVGDTEYIVVTVPEDATGIIFIEINARQYNATIKNGTATFEVDGLAVGNKTIAVTYWGDDRYDANFTTGQFEVKKITSKVDASSKDIKVGKDENIKISVPDDATGRVTVTIDGIDYSGEIRNGRVTIPVSNLPAGEYTAIVTYHGDDKYLPSETTTRFVVTKSKAPISADGDYIEIGDDGTVTVNLPEDATGTVTITVDGKKYTSKVINGKAIFKVPGLNKGEHKVDVYYSGDDKYDANETITDIVVDDNNNNNHGEGHGSNKAEGIALSSYETGNPIWVLLLIILAVGTAQLRRFRK
uniref:Ig-like domain repeat protein n=1 Tax=uncultured Methanobrevibacter sp. TaxID=253161 RepID=UPI00261147FE